MEARSPVDEQVLRQLQTLGAQIGSDVLQEVIGLFMSITPPLRKDLQEAINRQDFGEIGRLAHKQRGSVVNLGAVNLAKLLKDLEYAANDEQVEKIDELGGEVETEFNRVTTTLQQHWII